MGSWFSRLRNEMKWKSEGDLRSLPITAELLASFLAAGFRLAIPG